MSEEIFKADESFTQYDVENKELKEENEKLKKEENEKLRKEENEKLSKENEQLRKNNLVKYAEIKESIEKPKEIKSPEEDKNPNWFDKKRLKFFLAIIDSNKFDRKNKIGEFRYIEIKDLVNNIKNNTISEICAKKSLNILNEIKNAEIIKYKKRTIGQKELLNLFNDLLEAILTNKTLELKSRKMMKMKMTMKMKMMKH